MNYKVDTILLFDKEVKRLNRKYPSFKNDLTDLVDKLADDPVSIIFY